MLNYQRNGPLSPNCSSTNNSYVLQDCPVLTVMRQKFKFSSLEGLFSSVDTQAIIFTELWPGPVLFQPSYDLYMH